MYLKKKIELLLNFAEKQNKLEKLLERKIKKSSKKDIPKSAHVNNFKCPLQVYF